METYLASIATTVPQPPYLFLYSLEVENGSTFLAVQASQVAGNSQLHANELTVAVNPYSSYYYLQY